MARRDIKGITIDINGSTTGLDKALSGVNSSLSTVKKSLRDVNNLLKIDPKNTELLQQKQKLLAEAIDETKKKLEMEKEALEAAANQDIPADKMDALKREVIDTTEQLKQLEKAASDAGGTIGQKMEEAGTKVKAVGDKMSEVGGAMTTHVTAPIVAAAGASVAAFNEVDEGLDTVATKTGATGEALQEMQEIAKQIPQDINVGFDKAGEAVGEVNTRFGVVGDDLQELSEKFLKFAELNETDVTTSVDSVQEAMAAFNLGAEDAGPFLDTLNKVAQDTGVNVISLAESMTKNAAEMEALGYSASDSARFLGELEKKGIDTSTVTTGLRKALQNAVKEGKTMPEAMAELQDSMQNASTETEATQIAMELFGNKAGPAIAKAVQDGQLSFEQLSTSLEDNAGNIETTFESIQDAPDEFATTLNTAKVIGADVGTTLLDMLVPALQTVHELLTTAKDKWESMDESQKKMIITIAAIIAAIGPALLIGGKAVSVVGSVMMHANKLQTALQTLPALIGGVSAPVVAVTAGIAALIAIFVVLYNTNDEFRAKVQEVWGNIQEFVGAAAEQIQAIISAFCSAAQEFWQQHGDQIMQIAGAAWTFISDTISAALDVIDGIIKTATALISGDWEGAWNGIKETLSAVWDLITGIIDTGINAGKAVLDTVLDAIGQKFSDIWEGAKNTVSGAIDFIKGLFNFDWHLPDIALPHFSIEGDFSLMPPSVPHISVDWYDKAMDKVRVLTGASVFGYDAKANKLLGGGESGREVVSGESHLISLIDNVVGNRIGALGGVLGRVGNAVDKYLPRIAKAQEKPVVLDTGKTVGGIGKPMNEQFDIYAERDKWQ